jgi:hypothetical protein
VSIESQLAEQIASALARSLQDNGSVLGRVEAASAKLEVEAKESVRDEESFYRGQVHGQHIADMESARIQREKYARWVFVLVAGWIIGLFIILIAQGACPKWHTFSDTVLIALISSMTINLIGTLVIVLKYIFKAD